MNSRTTLMEKDTDLRVPILPALGGLPLERVSNEVLTEFFGKLRECRYKKKGRVASSMKSKAVQKRAERAGGRRDRGKPRRGLGEKSIKNIRTTLQTLLGFGVKWGYLSKIPELPEVIVPESTGQHIEECLVPSHPVRSDRFARSRQRSENACPSPRTRRGPAPIGACPIGTAPRRIRRGRPSRELSARRGREH